MRMSLGFAVDQAFRESGFISIGSETTKSDEYKANILEGATNKHEIASGVHIHQSETLAKYKSVAREFFHSCRQNTHSQDYKTYNEADVKNFLSEKIENGISWNTFQGYCSALEKLDDILNAVDNGSRDWHDTINEMRDIVKADDLCKHTDVEHRAFNNPEAVINNMGRPGTQLAAELELRTGLRSHDVTGQIKVNEDGTLNIKSKAGFCAPNFMIPADLSEKLKEFTVDGRAFLCTHNQYAYDLKKACEIAGEKFSGTHSLRHNFAQADYKGYIEQGQSEKEAKAHVSEDLFHSRLSIVETYLR